MSTYGTTCCIPVTVLTVPSDKSNFKLTPIFNASRPELDFSVQISLRTVIGITVEEVNIGALMLDLPAFNFTAATVTDSLSNCKPPPAGTSSDQIYAELIHINGDLLAVLSYELLGGDESGVLDSWTMWDGLHECYAFFPGLGFIGAVPPSSKSKLLTAPPITTCTTGTGPGATGIAGLGEALKGLSPGEKAGAVIGEVLFCLCLQAVVLISNSRDSGRRQCHRSSRFLCRPWQRKTRYQESQNKPRMDGHPKAKRWQLHILRSQQTAQRTRILPRRSQRANLASVHIRAYHRVWWWVFSHFQQ